jgi:hypothetical protein
MTAALSLTFTVVFEVATTVEYVPFAASGVPPYAPMFSLEPSGSVRFGSPVFLTGEFRV